MLDEKINYLNKMKVGFVTNFHNYELLSLSVSLYRDLANGKIIMIDGSKGFYGYHVFNQILSNNLIQNEYDYLVYIDEDAFISNIDELFDTIKFFIENNYGFCGMPDGGVISHRFHNPVSINTFFTIFNLKEIKKIYTKDCAINCQYEPSLEKYTPYHLIKKEIPNKEDNRVQVVINEGYKPYDIIYDNFEPYYRIFFYLLKNELKPYYLNGDDSSEIDGDGATTKLYGINNKPFCYHTWFARQFETYHNNRIKTVFNKIKELQK